MMRKLSTSVLRLLQNELKLLSDTVTSRSPCNVLVFGLAPQYLTLSSINTRGITVILEDEQSKTKAEVNPNNTRIYSLKYHQMEVKNAYKLLRHARANPACAAPNMYKLHQGSSECKLKLKDLPQEVYNTKWDVIVVDGPRGDDLEAPARQGSSNSTTDVLCMMCKGLLRSGSPGNSCARRIRRNLRKERKRHQTTTMITKVPFLVSEDGDAETLKVKANLHHLRMMLRRSGFGCDGLETLCIKDLTLDTEVAEKIIGWALSDHATRNPDPGPKINLSLDSIKFGIGLLKGRLSESAFSKKHRKDIATEKEFVQKLCVTASSRRMMDIYDKIKSVIYCFPKPLLFVDYIQDLA
ncbi:hypothetical protein Bca52824_095754 [Brassica carinata]|uniref:DUF7751 domain-containing protein n=1 Tax=Brassica carinata TaxID=52824 RepID=A0A8X7THP2_BRACI|nr:hypothetical protein Bca52824_095754 [Brassica carinata]